MILYDPDWEALIVALKRVVAATGASQHQARTHICHAIADKKIAIRVVVDPSHRPDGGRTFGGGNVGVPPRLEPGDFDWTHSRPLKPWSIGPMPGQNYTWIGGWENRPLSLIELSTADLRAVLCEASSTTTDAVKTQRPGGATGGKSPNNQPPRKRVGRMQYNIQKAVTDLESRYGKPWPPDDMPAKDRDNEILKWLEGDDDPVKPSTRTLRAFFSKRRT